MAHPLTLVNKLVNVKSWVWSRTLVWSGVRGLFFGWLLGVLLVCWPQEYRAPSAIRYEPVDVLWKLHRSRRVKATGRVNQLLASPYRDTLEEIVGHVGVRWATRAESDSMKVEELAGYYKSVRDSIVLDSGSMGDMWEARETLAHEYGHAYAARHIGFLLAHVPENLAREGTYARTDRAEQVAEAFAVAVAWLAETPNGGGRAELDTLEHMVPGARLMVSLLEGSRGKRPFKDHPRDVVAEAPWHFGPQRWKIAGSILAMASLQGGLGGHLVWFFARKLS